MITTVLPTALTVSDLRRSLEFYCGLLGFRVAAEVPPPAERARWDVYHERVCGIAGARINVVYLEASDGQTHLELIEYVRPKPETPPRRAINEPGTAIVALGVSGAEAEVRRLREAGVAILSDPVPYRSDEGVQTTTTYLYDPDGNLLCLFETVKN